MNPFCQLYWAVWARAVGINLLLCVVLIRFHLLDTFGTTIGNRWRGSLLAEEHIREMFGCIVEKYTIEPFFDSMKLLCHKIGIDLIWWQMLNNILQANNSSNTQHHPPTQQKFLLVYIYSYTTCCSIDDL